jgi:3-dehydroquinate dehydratase/shikimate dehydrogenase
LTFASANEEAATAPGQITASQLKGLFRWNDVDTDTTLFGLIGSPVAQSLSPAIFNAGFAAASRNSLFLPILIDGGKVEFNEFIENIVTRMQLGFSGFSVTKPHKANAIAYLEKTGGRIDPLAVAIGAVNTLKVGFNGLLSGYNTDYAGAIDALVSAMGIGRHDLHSAKVAVIGAGGAARAVVAGLCDVGAKVTIYNRTLSKAEGLAGEFGAKAAPLDAAADCSADIMINCTSIGMQPDIDASPVPKSAVSGDMVVFDTVYNPAETLLLKYAKAAGAKTVCGAEMFIRQAMAQHKIFTGSDADDQIMRKTVFDCLGS